MQRKCKQNLILWWVFFHHRIMPDISLNSRLSSTVLLPTFLPRKCCIWLFFLWWKFHFSDFRACSNLSNMYFWSALQSTHDLQFPRCVTDVLSSSSSTLLVTALMAVQGPVPRGKLSGSDQKPSETAFLTDTKELITELGLGFFNKLHNHLTLHFSRSYFCTVHGRVSRGTGLNVFLKLRNIICAAFHLPYCLASSPLPCQGKNSDYQKTRTVNQFWFGYFSPP